MLQENLQPDLPFSNKAASLAYFLIASLCLINLSSGTQLDEFDEFFLSNFVWVCV